MYNNIGNDDSPLRPVKVLDQIDCKLEVFFSKSRYYLPGTSPARDMDCHIIPLDLVICQVSQFGEVVYPLVICESSRSECVPLKFLL